ncbi:hypothetical protein M441DRAFT_272418 [Trichoderma asperellum CBS 433.97]|uniref:Secreted protein n=1 Tax=Trichoderma asperellum (strain ATCC 204424 / CBS 433.97 / NBRC 101777) TaxID=1042311 RepID=A0A2T3YWJ9_TRIA4|nr:hypothetical protein M441DRAFT_272418 [Trichoderma asperellum CBS 433.97]PTB36935.1 hypothetical protein M441DRAFT_272418 [Trichoderma asperellum CBS 433.97]
MLSVAFLSSVLCSAPTACPPPLSAPRHLFSRQWSYYLLAAADGLLVRCKRCRHAADRLLARQRAAGNIERGSRCMLRLPHSTNAWPTRVAQRSACQARPISKSPRYFIGCNKTPSSARQWPA